MERTIPQDRARCAGRRRYRRLRTRCATFAAVAVFGAACASDGPKLELRFGRPHARNVILFVGDGMGLTTVSAARILEGQQRGAPGEENLLSFETLPHVALAKTYNTNQQVPDSAGTMTALVSGVKTKAQVLGVDDRVVVGDHRSVASSSVPTLLEEAEDRGLATGVITTTTLTHATPAACYAHSADRAWENDRRLPEAARHDDFPDIARQFVEFDHGDGIDVAMGGGRVHFLPGDRIDPEWSDYRGERGDGRDLVAEWQARHPDGAYVWNRAQFDALDPAAGPVLGLFEPWHMRFEAERAGDPAGEPSLAEMTAFALDALSTRPDGFVLVVEAGRIDHGHHLGNAYRALTDTIELSNAVRVALERTDASETLIVVTADHGHVFTMGGYPTRGNDILGLVMPNDSSGQPAQRAALDASGHPFTTLGYGNGPGYPGASDTQPEGAKRFPHQPGSFAGSTAGRPDLSGVDTSDPSYLQEAAVPLALETHSGEDVPIYAGGPGAEQFRGVREQSFVRHAIAAALGWQDPPR